MSKHKLYNDYRDLWEQYYPVRFRHFEAVSEDRIARFGTRVSGIGEIDREIERYMVESELSINQMLEFHRKGSIIRLINYDDSAEIYEIIQRHLIHAMEHIRSSVNGYDKDLLKDLIELDQFATVVYDKAKSIFTDRERAALYSNTLGKLQTLNYFNILKNRTYSTIDNVKVTKNGETKTMVSQHQHTNGEVKERSSMSDVFAEHLSRIGGLGNK